MSGISASLGAAQLSHPMPGPLAAIRTVLMQYATFSDRAPRAQYWWFTLFAAAAGVLAGLLDLALFGVARFDQTGVMPVTDGLALALFLPGLAVLVRRPHDVGLGGAVWVGLTTLLQLYAFSSSYVDAALFNCAAGAVAVAVLLVAAVPLIQYIRPCHPRPNRFGPPPCGPRLPDAEVFR